MNSSEADSDSAKAGKRRALRRLMRVSAWTAGGFVLAVLIIAIALVALVNRDGVHHYLLEKAQDEASERLGVRVGLQNFTLHLSTLSLDLYGLSVDGAAPYAHPALLQVDHVQIGARIVSILTRKWYLAAVQVDHPVAWIKIDKNGLSNLPQLKSSNGGNNTSVFDLGIRHAVLNRGEVYFNSRPSALEADVHNLEFHADFNSLLAKYSGKLAYTNAHLQYGSLRPITHDLNVSFDATPSTFHLTQATVSSGPSRVVLSATLNNYSNPDVQAKYDATVDGNQVGQILRNASVPSGLVRATGTLHYRRAADRSLLQSVEVKGDLASRRLSVKTSSARGEIDALAAHYSLVNGDVTLHDLRTTLLDGVLTAQGTMKNVGGDSRSNVNAALHGVSLARLRQAFLGPDAQPGAAVSGTLDATAKASWGKTLDDLTARADIAAKGQVFRSNISQNPSAGGAQSAAAAMPVESAIHGTYSAANKQLTLENSHLHTPQTNVNLNGVVGRSSSLTLAVQANDLCEVAEIADLFRTQPGGESPQPLDLRGEATFAGKVQGTTAAPHLTGTLSAANVHFNGTEWKSLRTDVELSPSRAGLEHATFEPASGGHVTLTASAVLDDWSFTKQSSIQAQLNASRLNVAELMKLAQQQIPVTGILDASVTLHGSELRPQGSGNVALSGVTAYDEPIQAVNVGFTGDGNGVHANFSARLAGGEIKGDGTVQPEQQAYSAQITSSGVDLGKLHAVEELGINASGVVALRVNGHGTFDNPQLDASLQIPTLTMQDQKVSSINLHASLANHAAQAELTSSALGAQIRGTATVELSGDYQADASLDTDAFALGPLIEAYAPDEAGNVSGQTELHATLHGPLNDRNQLEAHATIPVLKVGYSNTVTLAATAPIQIDYKNGVVNLQPTAIHGTDTDLKLQAAIPISGGGAASLLAQGMVNLQLLQLFNPELRSSGEVKLNINSHGPLTGTGLNGSGLAGEIDVVDANLSSADLPVGLQHGNGTLTLSADRLNIDKFQGTLGGGTVMAQGGIVYRPQLQFNMGVAAQGVRILYPEGMRESVDATLRLTGNFDQAMLGGNVNLTDLSFTPAFDLNTFVGQFSGGVEAPQRGFAQNVALNIGVQSTNNVNLVSRTLSVGGSANLQVRGTAAQPVILGRVNLSGGDIIANGNRFVLTGGTVQFVNPSETEPVVNLMLTTSIQQYNINLRFNGPMAQLRTEYSSDPALPTADIINLLAFGETTEASAQSTLNTDQQAESLVASQVSSQVTSRVSKVAGISQLSISPVLAGSSSEGPPGANITIQQRVTSNLFVTFSSNVASTQGQTIQGQYKVSPRVSLSATRDPNGGFAVDALIKKSW